MISDALSYIKRKKIDEDTLNIFIVISGGRSGALINIPNNNYMKRLSNGLPKYIKTIKSDDKVYLFYDSRVMNKKYASDENNMGKILNYGPDCIDNLGGKFGVEFSSGEHHLFSWRCFKTPDSKYIESMKEKISNILSNIDRDLEVNIIEEYDKEDFINLLIESKFLEISLSLNRFTHYLGYGGGLLFELSAHIHEAMYEGDIIKFLRLNKELLIWALRFSNRNNIEMINRFTNRNNDKALFKAVKENFGELDSYICNLLVV